MGGWVSGRVFTYKILMMMMRRRRRRRHKKQVQIHTRWITSVIKRVITWVHECPFMKHECTNALHVAGWHKQKNGKLSLTYNLQAAACSAPLLPPKTPMW
jgi:hypothetical protein